MTHPALQVATRVAAALLVGSAFAGPALAADTWLLDGPPTTTEIFVPDTQVPYMADEPVTITTTVPTADTVDRTTSSGWSQQAVTAIPATARPAPALGKILVGGDGSYQGTYMARNKTRVLMNSDRAAVSRPAYPGASAGAILGR